MTRVVLVVVGLAACRHAPTGPAETVASFSAAVERADHAAAYALMSEEYQRRIPFADFKAEIEAGGAEAKIAARKLREAAPRTAPRVEVELGLGERLPLVFEDGAWRVDAPPYDLYSQDSPRAALRAFIRAVDRKRYDVLVRLMPARYRGVLTPDKLRIYWEGERAAANRALVDALRAAVPAARIVELGETANMPYGNRAEARLVREDGLWKIEDPD